MQKTTSVSQAYGMKTDGLTVNDSIYHISILHRDQFSHYNVERQLSCVGYAHDHVRTDQNIDALRCRADDCANHTEDGSSDEAGQGLVLSLYHIMWWVLQVSTAEDVAKPSYNR